MKWIKIPADLLEMSSNAVKLYFHVASKGGTIEISQRVLANELGMSLQGLRTALRDLKQKSIANTVLTQCQHTQLSVIYEVARGQKHSANTVPTQLTSSSPPETPITPISLTHEEKVIINNQKEEVPYTNGTPPEYYDAWYAWIRYKREMKDLYKNETTARTAFNRAVKLAGNDPVVFADIVEKSIANEWRGLFKPDGNGANRPGNQKGRGTTIADAAGLAYEFLSGE